MRPLVRNIRTGEFLTSSQTWTASSGEAFDFKCISEALEVVHSRGFRDMELVLGEAPPMAVPVAKLGLEYTRLEMPPKRRSRRKARTVSA